MKELIRPHFSINLLGLIGTSVRQSVEEEEDAAAVASGIANSAGAA